MRGRPQKRTRITTQLGRVGCAKTAPSGKLGGMPMISGGHGLQSNRTVHDGYRAEPPAKYRAN